MLQEVVMTYFKAISIMTTSPSLSLQPYKLHLPADNWCEYQELCLSSLLLLTALSYLFCEHLTACRSALGLPGRIGIHSQTVKPTAATQCCRLQQLVFLTVFLHRVKNYSECACLSHN